MYRELVEEILERQSDIVTSNTGAGENDRTKSELGRV
jgi:hypothetical protein